MTGMPWSGDLGPFALRSLSSALAVSNALGLRVMTALMAGPCLSYAAIRRRYIFTSFSEVRVPLSKAASMSAMVAPAKSTVVARAPEIRHREAISADSTQLRERLVDIHWSSQRMVCRASDAAQPFLPYPVSSSVACDRHP